LISLPTFLVAIKYPMCEGALFEGPYPLVGLEAEYDWQWNDVIKMNDQFATEHILTAASPLMESSLRKPGLLLDERIC
ncbi:hypothetical protein MUO65_00140, partial [bacterium]|nr:hypothetical protein [bacterium]